MLSRGEFRTFSAPGTPITLPAGINNRGHVTGSTLAPTEVDPLAGARGFLLARGAGGPFTPIQFPGAPQTFSFGLNDRGQILGAYVNADATPSP